MDQPTDAGKRPLGYNSRAFPLPGGTGGWRCRRNRSAGSTRLPTAHDTETERKEHLARQHARAPGGRSPLRPPDPPLEPQDEALHLRRARRHLHHRPAEDRAEPRRGPVVRAQPRRARRHGPVRRHQEAGPGRHRGRRQARGHAVRQPPLARRPAHELAHDRRAHRAPARAAAPAGRRPARAASAEGAHRNAGRAREARRQSRRRRGHAQAARRRLHRRPAQGAVGRARGAATRPPGDRARGHQLRPRRGRLRDSRATTTRSARAA